jgi:two-component system, OmpR family, sensor histidine kinase BaeS
MEDMQGENEATRGEGAPVSADGATAAGEGAAEGAGDSAGASATAAVEGGVDDSAADASGSVAESGADGSAAPAAASAAGADPASAAPAASEPKGPVIVEREASKKPRKKLFAGVRNWWSNRSYTTRVTLAFAFVAAMTALVAIGVLSFVWQQHFRTYTQENMKSLAESTATRIEEVYATTHTLRDPQVEAVAKYAESLNSGVGIAIIDNTTGKTIYDSSAVTIEDGTTAGAAKSSSSTSSSSSSSSSGTDSTTHRTLAPPTTASQQFTSAAIEYNGTAVGSVRIWVYGSDVLLTQADQEFSNNSYQAMVFATVLAIVLASCIGFLFARALVRPINRMASTARAIKEGDLTARTGIQGEDEVARLGMTFDQMADSIERDRKLERRLTTDVAHELRTPLMAIQATVEAMVDGVFEPTEERLETVNSEVQRLSRLVDAILKLSRLENRSTPMKHEPLDVGDLIGSIISTHEAYVNESGLKLVYEVERGVRVCGDADMIRQATANLISNAVRYTPEGGTITVSVSTDDDMCAIAVRDTGIGLSPDEAKMVFSRFWRADAGRTRERGGLGIGLSVVKEIVDRHNGRVLVEGEKGKGACFTILLPLYSEDEEHRDQRQRERQQQKEQQQAHREQTRAQREQWVARHTQKTGIPFGKPHDDEK